MDMGMGMSSSELHMCENAAAQAVAHIEHEQGTVSGALARIAGVADLVSSSLEGNDLIKIYTVPKGTQVRVLPATDWMCLPSYLRPLLLMF